MTRVNGRGDFESDARGAGSDELLATWNRRWGTARPRGWELRHAFPDQWVRFHTLPGSKRHADSTEEAHEIRRRQRSLVDDVLAGDQLEPLLVIAEEWGPEDAFGGWSRKLLPESWPWESSETWHLPADDLDPEAPMSYFWVASGLSSNDLDRLLTTVAEDQGRCVVTDVSVEWLLCPYDGGVDVLAPTVRDRDLLKDRHANWLSGHPDGL